MLLCISPLRDILVAIGSVVRMQEGYGIIFLEGADYVLTRSRSKLQSCCTKWGIKREREKEFSGYMNDVCWFQWGKGEIGLLQLYENYQGSNPSGFSLLPVTQILSLGIQIPLVNAVWIVAVLGISMDTPLSEKKTWLCVGCEYTRHEWNY